jgi:uncharacterized caspase-like protein
MWRFALVVAMLIGFALAPAEARRVALIVGQGAYPGGAAADKRLPALANPKTDARRLSGLLAGHGFEVISCDATAPGCFDLTSGGLALALAELAMRAKGADLAFVYFAGHGMATAEGNIIAPIDAEVDCATGG